MQPLDFGDFNGSGPRQRWLDCGPFQLFIAYCSPRALDRFTARMFQLGIWSQIGVTVSGREQDHKLEFAKTFIKDWRGVTERDQPIDYSAEKMALALSERMDIWLTVQKAVMETDDFFGHPAAPQT